MPPSPVLAPGSALGWRPRAALSSAQVSSVYPGALRPCKSLLLGPGSPLGVGRRQFLLSCGPDCLGPTCQLVGKVVRGNSGNSGPGRPRGLLPWASGKEVMSPPPPPLRPGEGDIVDCETALGNPGDPARSPYASCSMKTIHHVPIGAMETNRTALLLRPLQPQSGSPDNGCR